MNLEVSALNRNIVQVNCRARLFDSLTRRDKKGGKKTKNQFFKKFNSKHESEFNKLILKRL